MSDVIDPGNVCLCYGCHEYNTGGSWMWCRKTTYVHMRMTGLMRLQPSEWRGWLEPQDHWGGQHLERLDVLCSDGL